LALSGPDDPSSGSAGVKQAAAREAAATARSARAAGRVAPTRSPFAQVVRSEHEKIGRNQPCYCGSGKKFKLCHGKLGQ